MTPVCINGLDVCVSLCVYLCSLASVPAWKQCRLVAFLSVVAVRLPDGFKDPCGILSLPNANRNGLDWFWQLYQVLIGSTNS